MADLQRSIPSMVDGLEPGQRKILFCAFKMKHVKEFRVTQLSHYVSTHSAYKHGEAIIESTIIRMAQDFVGSNNLNLLKPNGQFGTRCMGGKDQTDAEYIFTKLSPITRYLFPKDDDICLDYRNEGGISIEPTWYVPVIPTVLVNGSQGNGTGLSTSIPNYNPRDIIANLRRLLNGEAMDPMEPWYKGFRGIIEKSASKGGGVGYTATGLIEEIDETTLCITELPIGRWSCDYDNFLSSLVIKNRKFKNPFIKDVRKHGDIIRNVHLEVILSKGNLALAKQEGLLKKFKLTTNISTSNMYLLDSNGVVKKYDTPEQILDEFFHVRLLYYEKRKKLRVADLESGLLKLENKVRFIRAVGTSEIIVFGKRATDLFVELRGKGFTPYPKNTKVSGASDDYEYLLSMATGAFTVEKFEELCAERDRMIVKVDEMKKTTLKSLWMKDLDSLESQLNAQDERDEREKALRREAMGGFPFGACKCSRKNTKKDLKAETDNAPEVAKLKGKAADAKKAPSGKKKAPATLLKDEDDACKINSPPEQSQDNAPKIAKPKGKVAAATKAPSRKRKALATVLKDEDDGCKIIFSNEQSQDPDSTPEVAKLKGKATRKRKAAATVLKDEDNASKINSSSQQSQAMETEGQGRKGGKRRAQAAQKKPVALTNMTMTLRTRGTAMNLR